MEKSAIDFFKSLHPMERRAICKDVGISENWLRNILYQGRLPSVQTAIRLAKVTNWRVSPKDIRPDIDWSLIKSDEL